MATATAASPATRTITGRIPYNVWSQPIPTADRRSFRERIMPGAFRDSLRSNDTVAFRIDHGTGYDPADFGNTADGELVLTDADDALRFALTVPMENERRALMYRAAQNRRFGGVSFAMRVHDDHWSDRGDYRSVHRAQLRDISLVSDPAYREASYDFRQRLGRFFHPSDVDTLAAHANDVERRLVECERMGRDGVGYAQQIRQRFLAEVRGRLPFHQEVELRNALLDIGPPPS